MNKAKLYMFISISILVFSISSTLALYIWRSTTNAIVNLEVCAPIITFVGGSTINGEGLIPVLSKENGLKKEISVKLNKLCQDGDSAIMNLYMTLDLLPKELQEDTFIYELYQEDKLIISDNFKGKSEGKNVTLLENEIVTDKELKYTLYIYIDGKKDNPIAMSNKPFKFSLYGEGEDAIYEENYIRATGDTNADSLFLNTDIKREEIESIKTVDTNIVPESISKSFDISSKGDGSVMLWYEDANSNNLYEVYMGSSSGQIKLNANSRYLFANLTNAIEIDLSKLETSKVTNMSYMFSNCNNLANLDISNFDTSKVTSMQMMFAYCYKVLNLDVSNFNTSKVTDMSGMFDGCKNITSLNLSNFNTSSVIDMNSMFTACFSLTTLDLSNFDTSKVISMYQMFRNCSTLVNLDLRNFSNLEVNDMISMFRDCPCLVNIDLSSFYTPSVTNMASMFHGCSSLKSLNLSNFDTSNVNDMRRMFTGCSSLISLDLSKFKTEKVTTMWQMFMDCSSLITLDLSNFDTSSVIGMSDMFRGCTNLTNLNLSSFTTEKVTNMSVMFGDCKNLKEIDFRNADFLNVTDYSSMFAGVPASSYIYVKDTTQKEWLLERFPNYKNIVVV